MPDAVRKKIRFEWKKQTKIFYFKYSKYDIMDVGVDKSGCILYYVRFHGRWASIYVHKFSLLTTGHPIHHHHTHDNHYMWNKLLEREKPRAKLCLYEKLIELDKKNVVLMKVLN